MRILTVDDDPFFLEVLGAILGTGGFDDVTTAASAQEAAQIVSDAPAPFDCVFIDLRMPEIEGDYLCRWMRRLPEYRETNIVMLTASGATEDVRRAFLAGASDYLTKPVVATDVIARARRIAASDGGADPQAAMASDATAGAGPSAPTFFDPVRIEGVKRAVKLDALANYLTQIGRSDTNKLSAITFRMREGMALHRRCSAPEFNRVLAAVARAILTHAKLPHPFIAYAGSGIFVIVSDAAYATAEDRQAIEAAIDAELAEKGLAQDDGTAIEVTVAMMEPQQLGGRTEQQKVTAMYRAIVDAEKEVLSARFGVSAA